MSKHTPGLLTVEKYEGACYFNGKQQDGFAIKGLEMVPDYEYPMHTEANARRLAACWNACEGLSTESLERLGTLYRARVSLDVKRNAQLEAEWVVLRELQRKCREAIAQRDELLAALRRLSFAAVARDNTMGDPCRLIEVKAELAAADRHAMAVIAKATRSAP